MPIQKILVVDDSAVERYAMVDMLGRMGYQVVEATDGADAQIKAELHAPDLILMDVVMPGISGFQATRQMSRSAQLSAIPIVMCTSKDTETDRVWGLRQGAKAYMVKPISERALMRVIRGLDDGQAFVSPTITV